MNVPHVPRDAEEQNERRYILLVRHGETDDNKNGVFQGQRGSNLNDKGRMQAEKLAMRLSSASIDLIVSSDLSRAKETAEILGRPHSLSVSLDQDLREVDVGHWTERTYAEIKELYPDEWNAWQAGHDVRRGNGETYAELGVRMMRALSRVSDLGKRVAVCVSHGGAIRSVVQSVLGREISSHLLAGALNTSVTLLEHDSTTQAFRILVYNDAHHLEDPVLARVRAT